MNEPKLRVFTIQVQQTFVFYGNVEVTAATEEEAREQAIEEFQCDWSRADETDLSTHLIAVEEP
jgi:hypothetical protein